VRVEILTRESSAPNTETEAYRRCLEIRHVVFVLGQAVSADLEFDGLDAQARHFLAFGDDDSIENALGTARMRVVEDTAKAERIGVLESARGLGIGRALVAAIEAHARSIGIERIRLNAQTRVTEFYEKLGYEAYGEPFVEAGIDHRAMKKSLR
jgi:predicted GNAT family N-acyltransferase